MKIPRLIYAFTILLGLSTHSISHATENCSPTSDATPLHLTYPASSDLTQLVDVQFEIVGDLLKAHFNVRTTVINAKENLATNEYPYQHDVVELFISVSGMNSDHFPYYEFEVSPFDQTLQVQILSLKKPFINNVSMGLQHFATKTSDGWEADIMIPLSNLKWDGQISKIIGNAYSIQGASPSRSFWGLFLPPQSKPNFHQPQYFKPFFKCE